MNFTFEICQEVIKRLGQVVVKFNLGEALSRNFVGIAILKIKLKHGIYNGAEVNGIFAWRQANLSINV